MKNSGAWSATASASVMGERPMISGFTRSARMIKDHLTRWVVMAGGLGIIGALLLMFAYLLYEVLPLFYGAEIKQSQSYELEQPLSSDTHVLFDELTYIQLQISHQGESRVVRRNQGWAVDAPISNWGSSFEAQHRAVDPADPHSLLFFKQDQLQWRKIEFVEVFDQQGVRSVEANTLYPIGQQWFTFVSPQTAFTQVLFREVEDAVLVAAVEPGVGLHIKRWLKTQSFLSETIELEADDQRLIPVRRQPLVDVLVDPDLRWVFMVYQEGVMDVMDLRQTHAQPYTTVDLNTQQVTSVEFLLGGFSLLVGDAQGRVTQWMPVRDDQNQYQFSQVRQFSVADQPIRKIVTETRRKGFVAIDELGQSAYFNTTSEKRLLETRLMPQGVAHAAISPRGDYLWVQQANEAKLFAVDNPHPEVSWKSLWQKVWYEGYQGPEYLWQSSASNNDFEPKFSLVPLSFGTLKAAFYAMLLAMPLAICGAIFTAYFMAPRLRTKVKPMIEMMEALPTVILGFLAGLWLAPLVEQKLPGIVVMLCILPVLILLAAFTHSRLPKAFRDYWIRPGWEPLWLVPVVMFGVWLSMALSDPMQIAFFDGDIRKWLTQDLGINFDQRNALVVGFVMGFAVIPTIFSIAEDAIFGVPKHLSYGSLALGATSWQTLVRVVLPTASPGIFSAVMIGFGRAIGETMIVLMATGNTPIMDMNIFEGFRTLSANIAVEMPEAEVQSSHYRILFLAAFVLLAFTFLLNTTAELIRQNLRNKYGSL